MDVCAKTPLKSLIHCSAALLIPLQVGPLRIGDDDKLSPETSLLVEEEVKALLKVSTPVHSIQFGV